MAVTLTDDLIGDAFGESATPKGLDGLTEITYDRVDCDYQVNEASVTVRRQRLVVMKYTPPAGGVWIDIYNSNGKKLLISRKTTVNGVARQTTYLSTVVEVVHRRFGANLEEFTIMCTVMNSDLNKTLISYPNE